MRAARPRATLVILIATVVVQLVAETSGILAPLTIAGGFIPARFSGLTIAGALPAVLTPLSAALLHAGLLHLALNMLMLGYCGRQTEMALGPAGLVVLYLVGAYAAAAAQYVIGPVSPVPMIGASGAISAVVGAYALLFGERRPAGGNPRLARALHVLWLAAAWIGVQLLLGLVVALSGVAIATAAHVGGFLAGLALAGPLLRWRYRRA